jgi:hypothetical protein
VLYERHSRWGLHGRCIGHGGYPYFRVKPLDTWSQRDGLSESAWYSFQAEGDIPGGLILGDENPFVTEKPSRFGAQGFAILELSDRQCMEEYHRPDGALIYRQEIAP